MSGRTPSAPRCAAIVGPYLSGKTTLMEAMLSACGAIHRKGSVKDGSSVGDAAPEARAHNMSVEMSLASAEFLGEQWHFVDCPGSVEFLQDTYAALSMCDVAVVVCEPEASRALTLGPLFHFLDAHDIPHMLFINKMDTVNDRVRELLEALQSVSENGTTWPATGGAATVIRPRAMPVRPRSRSLIRFMSRLAWQHDSRSWLGLPPIRDQLHPDAIAIFIVEGHGER